MLPGSLTRPGMMKLKTSLPPTPADIPCNQAGWPILFLKLLPLCTVGFHTHPSFPNAILLSWTQKC
jgi:hypothetical protein